ncbi:type II toxin-antitoxin system HigB family toxin [Psychroflexus sp. MBR-150]
MQEFAKKHADVETPLNYWYHTTNSSSWKNLSVIRNTFNGVDYVGNK